MTGTSMKFAINLPNFGTFADTRLLADLAAEAEAHGWDGFFLWDHTRPGTLPVADPWIALTAIALATERIRLGPMVVPLPRRRPEEVARQCVALDHLSNGRLILGVGIGDDLWREFSAFGHELDAVKRGQMLDEALEVLTGLWQRRAFQLRGTLVSGARRPVPAKAAAAAFDPDLGRRALAGKAALPPRRPLAGHHPGQQGRRDDARGLPRGRRLHARPPRER